MKLMPIVLVRRDEVAAAVAACKRADGQNGSCSIVTVGALATFLSI